MNVRQPVLTHSQNYKNYDAHVSLGLGKRINPNDIQQIYSNIDDYLRECLDDAQGIVRNVVYANGTTRVIRDATLRKNSADINPQHVERYQMLVRVLGVVRSLDYMLMRKGEENNALNNLRIKLFEYFDSLKKSSYQDPETPLSNQKYFEKLQEIENNFNNSMKSILQEAGLNCTSTEEYAEFFAHLGKLSLYFDHTESETTISYERASAVGNETVSRQIKTPVYSTLPVEVASPPEAKAAVEIADQYFSKLKKDNNRTASVDIYQDTFTRTPSALDRPDRDTPIHFIKLTGKLHSDECKVNELYIFKDKDMQIRYFIRFDTEGFKVKEGIIELNTNITKHDLLKIKIDSLDSGSKYSPNPDGWLRHDKELNALLIDLINAEKPLIEVLHGQHQGKFVGKMRLDHIDTLMDVFKDALQKQPPEEKTNLREPGTAVAVSIENALKKTENLTRDDLSLFKEALRLSTRIVGGEFIDINENNNPVSELDNIRKQIDKSRRWKQVAAAIGFLVSAAVITFAIVSAIALAPVTGGTSLVGMALGIAATKVIVAGLLGLIGISYSVKTARKEWKHEKSPLKLVSTELKKFTDQAKEQKNAAYVKAPFSPDFAVIMSMMTLEHQSALDTVPTEYNYSEQKINQTLINPKFFQEISRVRWVDDIDEKATITVNPPSTLSQYHSEEKQFVEDAKSQLKTSLSTYQKKFDIPDLTESELQVLLTVVSTGSDEKVLQQGGLLGRGLQSWSELFINVLLDARISAKPYYEVKKTSPDHLLITTVIKPTSLSFENYDGTVEKPYEYRETYQLVKTNQGWQLRQPKENSIYVNPDLWSTTLNLATAKLKETKFNDKDILFFIPCLSDKQFATAFGNRLKALEKSPPPVTADQYKTMNTLIEKNYGDHLPQHLKALKSRIEKQIPKPASQQRTLRL